MISTDYCTVHIPYELTLIETEDTKALSTIRVLPCVNGVQYSQKMYSNNEWRMEVSFRWNSSDDRIVKTHNENITGFNSLICGCVYQHRRGMEYSITLEEIMILWNKRELALTHPCYFISDIYMISIGWHDQTTHFSLVRYCCHKTSNHKI